MSAAKRGPGALVNTFAWILSIVVMAGGIIAWLVTDRPLFLVFTALGVLTVVNVVVYDRMVLHPRKRAAARAAAERADSGSAEGEKE